MATILEVAARAGVGVGTVSRVLNGSPRVREQTRRRVLDAIEKLDYVPSQLGRALSRGRSVTIGVIIPFVTHPGATGQLRGIVGRLTGVPYDLVLVNVEMPAQRDHAFRTLARRDRAEAVLVVSLPPRDREVERYHEAGVPAVLVDARHRDLPHVVVDNLQGGYLATRHLIQLGHRRIAFLGDPRRNPFGFTASEDRRRGYLRALEEAGIPVQTEYVKTGPFSRDVARELAEDLLALSKPPTAVFAASDLQALGVLEAAESARVSVPEALSVIGFDDIEAARYVGLTTVRQPLYECGVRGAELLLRALEGQRVDPGPEELPLELIVRSTTALPGR
jgi:LacI family transcriptional regulator